MPDSTSAARAAILNRIRASNSGVDTAARVADYQAIARNYQMAARMDREAVLKMFTVRLREYDANLHETTLTHLRATLAQVFASYDQHSVVTSGAFPLQWLPEAFSSERESNADIAALNTARGAIVTCEVAIAHTGTIVLNGSRRLTLLPDRLVCIVREDQVVETVPEAFARLEPFAADALTFISGPSATADIEMTRIRGVHGPRFLDVALVRN